MARTVVVVALALALRAMIGSAAAMGNCSGTVGTTAQPVPLPIGAPAAHMEFANPSQNANSICVNPFGATASCGAAGTVTIAPGGDKWWNAPDIPTTAPSVIASGASTPYECDYQ
jgi:hypothetical protein